MAVAGAGRTKSGSGAVRRWVRRLHLWVGLSVGLVYALIALSGSVLVFQTRLLCWLHPQLAGHPLPDDHMRAAVLATLGADWSASGLRSADLPTPELPVWQLYFNDGSRRYLDPADGHLLLTRAPGSDLLLTLRDFHTRLLGGEAGEEVLGVLGWLTLGLLVSGIWLWWPGRGKLRASLRVHAQPPARRWLSWHRSFGALSLPLLLIVTLTGTLMIYSAGTRRVLQALANEHPPAGLAHVTPRAQPIDWLMVLETAQHALPQAQLRRMALPSSNEGRVVIRARSPGEWHPVGRSRIAIDPWQMKVLAATDASVDGIGARLSNAIYPLHAGSVGGLTGAWLVLLAGLLPPFFLVTGFLFWRARQPRKRR